MKQPTMKPGPIPAEMKLGTKVRIGRYLCDPDTLAPIIDGRGKYLANIDFDNAQTPLFLWEPPKGYKLSPYADQIDLDIEKRIGVTK